MLLLVGMMTPLAQMLSCGTDAALDQKQAAIARALEMEADRQKTAQYSPVLPLIEIEELWAIEDVREETDEQLVLGMTGPAGELGYDAQSRTFYCTLGLGTGDGIAWHGAGFGMASALQFSG